MREVRLRSMADLREAIRLYGVPDLIDDIPITADFHAQTVVKHRIELGRSVLAKWRYR
jgi:hypothetical protein